MSGKKHNMDQNKKHDIETDRVTPIQLIMLVIVLVFFIGAVVLYFLNAAPIAFILAAGGAVLVHYFLGGIARQTRFLWFGLKVGGALAALLSITYGANHYLEKQTRVASVGEYEWQWAGNGWIGYIDVAGDNCCVYGFDERSQLFSRGDEFC